MAVWTWHDPATDGLPDWPFAVQGSSSTTLSDTINLSRNFQTQLQPLNGGLPLLFEGMATPTTESIQGFFLTNTNVQNLLDFYSVGHQTTLTDDLGIIRSIYCDTLQVVRIKSAMYPWKFTYNLTFFVLSYTGTLTFSYGDLP